MMLHRLNIQSAGWWITQFHVTGDIDPIWEVEYTERNRPINFAARYTLELDSDGVPVFKQVADTRGPIGQWLCWPGETGDPGHMAQWGQVFPAIITALDPPKAKPIDTGGLAGWVTSTEFLEIAVYLPDDVEATEGMFGLCVVGTELGDQNVLFFPGGSGTSTPSSKVYKITATFLDGTYTGREYDYPGGSEVTSEDVTLYELNLAPGVPVNHYVEGTVRGDDNVWFSEPIGCAPE